MQLTKTLQSWDSPDFKSVVKNEIQNLDSALLPLQQGISLSSCVSDAEISAVILNTTDGNNIIHVKVGIFYTGIIAGCSCADDPTPLDKQNEYCELQFDINKSTADTTIILLKN